MKRLALCLALAGCTTAPHFPEPSPAWTTHTGQLRHTTAERSVIGEFSATHHGGDFRLEFSKGGAVPLLRIARHGQHARAEGPLARGRWSGLATDAPAPLRGWLIDVPRAFTQPAPRIELTGPQPGERFVFILNR